MVVGLILFLLLAVVCVRGFWWRAGAPLSGSINLSKLRARSNDVRAAGAAHRVGARRIGGLEVGVFHTK